MNQLPHIQRAGSSAVTWLDAATGRSLTCGTNQRLAQWPDVTAELLFPTFRQACKQILTVFLKM